MDQSIWTGIGAVAGSVATALGRLAWDKRKANGNGGNGYLPRKEFDAYKADTSDQLNEIQEKVGEIAEGVAFLRGKLEK